MMEEATKAQEAAASQPMADDTMAEVEKGLRQEITVTIDEQDSVQRMRAEASVLGERLGLGNMQARCAQTRDGSHAVCFGCFWSIRQQYS